MDQQAKYVFKILLCGSYAVGKTSLVFRFIEDAFKHEATSTIGANFLVKTIKFQENDVEVETTMQVWDVAGNIRGLKDVAEAFFLGSKAAFFVHDLTREWTLEDLNGWYKQVTDVVGKDIISMVIGNKTDLVQLTPEIENATREITDRIGVIRSFFTSAKTGDGVNEAFEIIAREYYRKYA